MWDGQVKTTFNITILPSESVEQAIWYFIQCFFFIAWIGSITGVSSAKLAISEIVVSFPDATFGKESRFGVPFTVSTTT